MGYYKNKNKNKNKNNKKSQKNNVSELLNSQKTKKRLVLNSIISGGNKNYKKKNNNENNENNDINRINSNHEQNININIQDGGDLKKSKALEIIMIKTYKYVNILEYKYKPKMDKILTKLYDREERKGISKVHRMINHILDLETRLCHLNKVGLGEPGSLDLGAYPTDASDLKLIIKYYSHWKPWGKLQVKEMKHWYGKLRGDSRATRTMNERIKNLQDYIRKKLMKELNFDPNIGNCTTKAESFGRVLALGTVNMFGSSAPGNKDTLLCHINKFRYYESKFNKYYKKYQTQFMNFINTMGMSCAALTSYQAKLKQANSQAYGVLPTPTIDVPDRFDYTLCQNFDNIQSTLNSSFNKRISDQISELESLKSDTVTSIYNKNKQKYINKAKNNNKIEDLKKKEEKIKNLEEISATIKTEFDGCFTRFTKTAGDYNRIFGTLELIGLKRYISNFPKDKKTLNRQLKELSKDQAFISEFEATIKPLGASSTNFVKDIIEEKDKKFEYELIPKVIANSIANVEIINIDMELYENFDTSPQSEIYFESINSGKEYKMKMKVDLAATPNKYYTASIICFQNLKEGFIKKITLELIDSTTLAPIPADPVPAIIIGGQATPEVTTFIPIAKSGFGKKISNSNKFEKYNVIYAKSNLQKVNDYIDDKMKDQSEYFKLDDLPPGIGIENTKSFVAINVISPEKNTLIIAKINEKQTDKKKILIDKLLNINEQEIVLNSDDIFSNDNIIKYTAKKTKLDKEIKECKDMLTTLIDIEPDFKTYFELVIRIYECYANLLRIKNVIEKMYTEYATVSIEDRTRPESFKHQVLYTPETEILFQNTKKIFTYIKDFIKENKIYEKLLTGSIDTSLLKEINDLMTDYENFQKSNLFKYNLKNIDDYKTDLQNNMRDLKAYFGELGTILNPGGTYDTLINHTTQNAFNIITADLDNKIQKIQILFNDNDKKYLYDFNTIDSNGNKIETGNYLTYAGGAGGAGVPPAPPAAPATPLPVGFVYKIRDVKTFINTIKNITANANNDLIKKIKEYKYLINNQPTILQNIWKNVISIKQYCIDNSILYIDNRKNYHINNNNNKKIDTLAKNNILALKPENALVISTFNKYLIEQYVALSEIVKIDNTNPNAANIIKLNEIILNTVRLEKYNALIGGFVNDFDIIKAPTVLDPNDVPQLITGDSYVTNPATRVTTRSIILGATAKAGGAILLTSLQPVGGAAAINCNGGIVEYAIDKIIMDKAAAVVAGTVYGKTEARTSVGVVITELFGAAGAGPGIGPLPVLNLQPELIAELQDAIVAYENFDRINIAEDIKQIDKIKVRLLLKYVDFNANLYDADVNNDATMKKIIKEISQKLHYHLDEDPEATPEKFWFTLNLLQNQKEHIYYRLYFNKDFVTNFLPTLNVLNTKYKEFTKKNTDNVKKVLDAITKTAKYQDITEPENTTIVKAFDDFYKAFMKNCEDNVKPDYLEKNEIPLYKLLKEKDEFKFNDIIYLFKDRLESTTLPPVTYIANMTGYAANTKHLKYNQTALVRERDAMATTISTASAPGGSILVNFSNYTLEILKPFTGAGAGTVPDITQFEGAGPQSLDDLLQIAYLNLDNDYLTDYIFCTSLYPKNSPTTIILSSLLNNIINKKSAAAPLLASEKTLLDNVIDYIKATFKHYTNQISTGTLMVQTNTIPLNIITEYDALFGDDPGAGAATAAPVDAAVILATNYNTLVGTAAAGHELIPVFAANIPTWALTDNTGAAAAPAWANVLYSVNGLPNRQQTLQAEIDAYKNVINTKIQDMLKKMVLYNMDTFKTSFITIMNHMYNKKVLPDGAGDDDGKNCYYIFNDTVIDKDYNTYLISCDNGAYPANFPINKTAETLQTYSKYTSPNDQNSWNTHEFPTPGIAEIPIIPSENATELHSLNATPLKRADYKIQFNTFRQKWDDLYTKMSTKITTITSSTTQPPSLIPIDIPLSGGKRNNFNSKGISMSSVSLSGGATATKPQKALTIVLTNLTGSRYEDLQYFSEYSTYTKDVNVYMGIPETHKVIGLRNVQNHRLAHEIHIHTGYLPDIVCGNLGGIMDYNYNKLNEQDKKDFRKLFLDNIKRDYPQSKVSALDKISDEDFTNYYIIRTDGKWYGMGSGDKVFTDNGGQFFKRFNNKLDTNYISFYELKKHFTNKKIFSNLTNYMINMTAESDKYTLEPTKFKHKGFTITNLFHDVKTDLSVYKLKKPVNPANPANPQPPQEIFKKDTVVGIFKILDIILRHFSYGREVYIQRDLGCLSMSKNSEYSKRNYDTNNKIQLYTLNFPSFVEVLLNQKTNNYNATNRSNSANFYSETQYSDLNKNKNFPQVLPIFKTYNANNQYEVMDVAIRLLLIPSKDVKTISGIQLTNPDSNYNQKHYKSLAKTFASSFYVKSKQKLELRLKTLLTPGVIKENKTDILSTDKNLDPEYYINFLLKKETVNGKVKLSNFREKNKSKILDFYEFIMILLKIKYYDYMIDKLSVLAGGNVGPFVGGGKTERKLISYTNTNTNRLIKNKSKNKSTLKKNKKTKTKLQNKEKVINSKNTKHALKI
jgi:hypothetical protein